MVTPGIRKQLLASYVKRIWSVDCHNQREVQNFRFYADGYPGLMFQCCDNLLTKNGADSLPPLILYGQTISPITLSAVGRHHIVAICFYPDVVQRLFGLPANEITDTCLDMSLLPIAKKTGLVERLLQASASQRSEIMEDFIFDLITTSKISIDDQIRHAANTISNTHGNTRITDIQKLLGISERTLHRRFEQHIGVVPKVFAGICRFRSAFDAFETGQFEKLSDLAFEFGYSDQSHFIRSFKSFTGQTPRTLLQ